MSRDLACDLSRAATELPAILYLADLARVLGRTEKSVRAMISRGQVPRPAKIGGRLAWARDRVLEFLSEIHAVERETALQITAAPYAYDPSRMQITFTIPASKTEPRRRTRKVAPAGLNQEAALVWARKMEIEIWRELMGEKEEPKPCNEKAVPKTSARTSASAYPTLREFWERFEREYLSQQKPNTRKGYSMAWRLYIGPILGDIPLDMIDKRAIGRLRAAIGKLEPTGRNQVLNKIRSALNTAARWDVIADEQVPRIRKDKEPKLVDPLVYTDEQAERLIDCAKEEGREFEAIVLLLLHGGLRVSEVCALRWEDVDFGSGILTIRHNYSDGEESTPKGDEPAPVGMSPALINALNALPRKSDHVLVRVGRVGAHKGQITHHTSDTIRDRLNKIQVAAGLEPSGPHRLRHSCLTIMARRGCDPWRLQAHARHAHISTTERYIHLARETRALEAAAVWATPAQTEPKKPNEAGKSAPLAN